MMLWCPHHQPFVIVIISCNRAAAQERDDEDVVHMGHAIMSFYSALIDLLGRCAPEMHVRFSSF